MLTLTANIDAFLKRLPDPMPKVKQRLSKRIQVTARTFHTRVMARTPVWTGQSVRNYRWGVDEAPEANLPALGDDFPGHTNTMALGSEPRRSENEADSIASLEEISFADPFHRFILANNAPQIVGLEQGIYPLSPLQQRSPEGFFRVTFAEVAELVESGVI